MLLIISLETDGFDKASFLLIHPALLETLVETLIETLVEQPTSGQDKTSICVSSE